MPDKTAEVTATGRVADLFGHRFVVATEKGKLLADLGPKGAERVSLVIGDQVTLHGERKRTEMKVHSLSVGGRDYVLKPDPKHADAEEIALAAVRILGFEPVPPVRRKPKHFEFVARRGEERLEFHVEFDGAIRKTRRAMPSKTAADQ